MIPGAPFGCQYSRVLAIHRDTCREWPVAKLAAQSHVLRSVFAERFKSIIGIPPLRYAREVRSASLVTGLFTIRSQLTPLLYASANGPELVSLALSQWAEEHGMQLEYIKPGKPTQNAFIERFNRTYRTEILDFYLFRILNEAGKLRNAG